MIYNWKYKTPKEYSNIIMNSDGESLIGLFFEDSKDSSKHEVNCKEEKLPILKKHVNGLIHILVVKSQILHLNIK